MTKTNLYVIIFSVSVAAAVYPPRLFYIIKRIGTYRGRNDSKQYTVQNEGFY